MPFRYRSGEEIKKSDRVIFHEAPGQVEFVADRSVNNPERDWYVQEFGGGVMIIEPNNFGCVFLTETENAEDLVFVSRASSTPPETESIK